jgi:hypothetical protein
MVCEPNRDMKHRTVIAVVVVFLLLFFFADVHYVYPSDPGEADFILRCVLALGTLSAVLVALFGDCLREWVDPVQVRIEVPEDSNTAFDFVTVDDEDVQVYCHHLCVINETPHKPIKECRVWLKRISTPSDDGRWKGPKFAVPRRMQWAPFEYSPDKRTFGTAQVFDFGMTFGNEKGFKISVAPEQGGTFTTRFPAGKKARFTFYVTADNYHQEREFSFEVDVPIGGKGACVTPSTVRVIQGDNSSSNRRTPEQK